VLVIQRSSEAMMCGSACEARILSSLLGWEVATDGEQQLVVGHVATRVDDGTALAVDHQKLVGLHCFAALVAEMSKHDAHMAVLVEEFNGHVARAPV
jgi:hypothetical protein